MNANLKITESALAVDDYSDEFINLQLAGINLEPAAVEEVRSPSRNWFARLVDLLQSLRQEYRKQRDYEQLLEMPDHMLIDVGLTPHDVRSKKRHPFMAAMAGGMVYDQPVHFPFESSKRGNRSA